MKKLLFCLIFILIPNISFGYTVTTNNSITGISGWGASDQLNGSRYWIAQKFTTENSGSISSVSISNSYTATAVADNANVVVELHGDNSGLPDRNVLATTNSY